jgi:hypothetical protein
MSSALAMVLTAVMAVPGNGPEMVSAEMEQGLDLRGRWEGSWQEHGRSAPVRVQMAVENGCVRLIAIPFRGLSRVEVVNEGEGRVRLEWFSKAFLGIYQQKGDRVVLCLRLASRGGYPASFVARDDQELFILHRVKPRE